MKFISSTERLEIEIGRRLYVSMRLWTVWFSFAIGGFLPVLEIKSVRWYFYYKLRGCFGNVGFEWIDNSKTSGSWNKPTSRSWYWGLGQWAAMTDEEYEAWRKSEAEEEVL